MALRIFSDEVYREYRDELDLQAEESGFKPTHADTLLNAPTDAPDGRHDLDATGYTMAEVRNGRIVSITSSLGGTGLEVLGWSVEEARRRRDEMPTNGEV